MRMSCYCSPDNKTMSHDIILGKSTNMHTDYSIAIAYSLRCIFHAQHPCFIALWTTCSKVECLLCIENYTPPTNNITAVSAELWGDINFFFNSESVQNPDWVSEKLLLLSH